MIPLLRSDEMRHADRNAVAARGVNALVRRAGTAVGLEAKRLLGSCYGARVAVLAGPGLNGADGRVAARWLRERGSRVDVVEVIRQPQTLIGYDLVIDAAFGLGCSREYRPPRLGGAAVLAVDLPSGVNADTGELLGSPLPATVTLALGALKHAHVTGESVKFVGELRYCGLDIVTSSPNGLVEDFDLDSHPPLVKDEHKWHHAVALYAGSTSMPGAAALVVTGAARGGASMIRLATRGSTTGVVTLPPEVVLNEPHDLDPRVRAVVAGPGLGAGAPAWLEERLRELRAPIVLDADGLDRRLIDYLVSRGSPVVLTPHDGEFARLTGTPVPEDRITAVRALARETGCVVLLKGPHTIVSAPDGTLRVVTSGTVALATAGTGDVLAGLVGGFLARGYEALDAAALAAHLHGRAGARLAPFASASALGGALSDVLALRRRDVVPGTL